MNYLFGTACLTALIAATPALAQAEEFTAATGDDIVITAQERNATQVLRQGQVGVLGDKSAADVPFSIKSYNEQLILNQQPQTLGQVLENDPTIRTTYGFGNASEQFIIRGFTLFADDISLNGLYGITPRQLVAPELYGSVQVLNGASAFLNGAAPGGTGFGGNVNLTTKVAGDSPLTRATANYTSSSHFGGSFDVARRFGANGEWGVRVNGAFRSGDVSIDDEFRRTGVIGASFDYRGDRARVFLDLAYQRYEVDRLRPTVSLATTTVPRVPGADNNYGQAFTETNLRDIFGTLRAEYDLSDNAMLYASAGAIDTNEDGIYSGITVTNAVTGAGTGGASIIPYERNGESVTGGLRVKLAAGGITNEVNIGGSHIWQVNRTAYDFRYLNAGFQNFATNLYDTPQVPLPTGFSFAGGDLDDPFPISRSRLGSAFASDTLGLFGDRVLITGGLRLQNISTSNYTYADGALDTRYNESAITPVAGLVVKPTEQLSLFFNRIEGLAAGATAPTLAQNPDVTNPGEVFAPFKTRQYEAGGKLFLGRVNLSVAAFQIDQPSAYVMATPTATNANAVTFGYNGQQRNRGIEVSVDGEPVRGLRVIAGGTYTDAKLRRQSGGVNEGNDVAGVPEWLANANVEWDLPFGATLTGRVVYTGEQWVDTANTLKLDDWTRFDVGARYVLPIAERPVTLRVTVDNVANKRYWASAFGAFGAQLLQGLPRTYKASLSVDF